MWVIFFPLFFSSPCSFRLRPFSPSRINGTGEGGCVDLLFTALSAFPRLSCPSDCSSLQPVSGTIPCPSESSKRQRGKMFGWAHATKKNRRPLLWYAAVVCWSRTWLVIYLPNPLMWTWFASVAKHLTCRVTQFKMSGAWRHEIAAEERRVSLSSVRSDEG